MLSFGPYPKVLYASLIPDLLPNRQECIVRTTGLKVWHKLQLYIFILKSSFKISMKKCWYICAFYTPISFIIIVRFTWSGNVVFCNSTESRSAYKSIVFNTRLKYSSLKHNPSFLLSDAAVDEAPAPPINVLNATVICIFTRAKFLKKKYNVYILYLI